MRFGLELGQGTAQMTFRRQATGNHDRLTIPHLSGFLHDVLQVASSVPKEQRAPAAVRICGISLVSKPVNTLIVRSHPASISNEASPWGSVADCHCKLGSTRTCILQPNYFPMQKDPFGRDSDQGGFPFERTPRLFFSFLLAADA